MRRLSITTGDISRLVALLRESTEVNIDLIAAESTFNAIEAFYKVHKCSMPPSLFI